MSKLRSISIIFPIYNEEKRLTPCFKSINDFSYKFNNIEKEIIFINDGSNDKSDDYIKDFISSQKTKENDTKYVYINYPKNQGKGFALKKGVLVSTNEWILTMDPDLSVSFDQLSKWLEQNIINNNKSAYFGSRGLKDSKVITKKYRNILGNIFSFCIKILFNKNISQIKDSQCGFKFYNKIYAKNIFTKLKENGFIHDIEILILLRKNNINVIELPVEWIYKEGSKINILRDSILMFIGLVRLKIKYKL